MFISTFTRVPVLDPLRYLEDELKKYDMPLPVHTIISLIKLCVLDSNFESNGKFYMQKFGMGMGNPLSPVSSNLYIEFFERDILPKIIPNKAIWHRYVDDILCMWPIDQPLDNFLLKLNSSVPSIEFTKEI